MAHGKNGIEVCSEITFTEWTTDDTSFFGMTTVATIK